MRKIKLSELQSSSREVVERAFQELYEEYHLLVFYVSFEITKNKADSDDIVSETFMKFYEKRFEIKKESGIKYLLVKTSENLSINLVTRNNRRDLVDNDELFIDCSTSTDLDSYLEKFKEILSKDELDLVIYHLIYDFSFKEIGEMFHKSTDSISGRYRRALTELKKEYKRR